jgi:hypothetical protein
VLPVLDTTHTTLDACTRSLSFGSRIRSCASHLLLRTLSIGASLSTRSFPPFFARSFLLKSSTSTCSTLLELLYSTLPLYSTTLLYSLLPPVRIVLITLPTTGVRTDATTTRSLPLPTPLDNSTRARPPAATLAAVSSPRRRAQIGPHSSAPCALPLPLARDSYHVALALPSKSRVLAAHHTSSPSGQP